MATFSEYREVAFSITPLGDYHWRWILHPPAENQKVPWPHDPNAWGELFGTYSEAEAAVKNVIDEKWSGSAAS